MNLLQLKDGLENNTISIDYKGHNIDSILRPMTWEVEHNQKCIEEYKNGESLGSNDKPCTKEDSDNMIMFYKSKLEHNFEVGRYFVGIGDYCCEDCGKRLYILPTSENSILLVDTDFINSENIRQGIPKYHPVKVDLNLIPDCSAKVLRDAGKLVAEIEVPTGELLFTNFFKKEKIYTMPNEYSASNSINSINGRNNLMQYLSTQNIGYGQMGNMSVNIFVNNAGDEIIIGSEYGYNEEDGEFDISHEGFTNYGSISLGVWRWMCGDIQILKEHGEKIPKNVEVNKHVENNYKDYICVLVKPGTWVIEHFYDLIDDDNEIEIYSKLYLKK